MSVIRFFLMGPPRFEKDHHPVDMKRRKTAALLAFLVMNRKPVTRETLAGLLWADFDQASASAYLRHTLWEIGAALGPELLQSTRESVCLSCDQPIWADVLRFNDLLSRWHAEQNPNLLEEAVGLYQADFLDRFTLKDSETFGEWQRGIAEDLSRRFSEALGALSSYHLDQRDAERALLHARRWLSMDNLNEPAHRLVIRAELLAGRRSAALRQYEACVRVLRAELGIDPDPATRALLDEIRAGPVDTAPLAGSNLSPLKEPRSTVSNQTPANRSSSLPKDPAPFIGRKMELSEIAFRLRDPDCRLLTLLGPGGIGKTRLALYAADEMTGSYPHGVVFVPLASVNSSENFLPAICSSIHLPGDPLIPQENLLPTLCAHLQDRLMLLVLDNMEHLTGCAEEIQSLLTCAPSLNVLVTSRERLNLPSEWSLEIGGMSFPFGSELNSEDYSAVQLFIHTARRVKTGFQLRPEDRSSVAQICRLVEGMPLGVELAASWVRLLTPAEILREIENSLDFLTSSQRGIPERHRSLRAVYEGSEEMLTPVEKSAFHRLARIPGGFSRELAFQNAGVNLALLSALVDKSLVRHHSDGHYDIHEVLRKYAVETPDLNANDARL